MKRERSAGTRRASTRRAVDRTEPPVRGSRLSQPGDDSQASPRFAEIRHPKKRLYLIALSRCWNFSQAAIAAGIDRATGLAWRQDTQASAFQAALVRAREMFLERAEAEMWRRGIDGVEQPVYQAGRLVGTIRVFDTTAAIFMLKGAKPETYRERYEHSGPNGGAIPVTQVTFGGRYRPPESEPSCG